MISHAVTRRTALDRIGDSCKLGERKETIAKKWPPEQPSADGEISDRAPVESGKRKNLNWRKTWLFLLILALIALILTIILGYFAFRPNDHL